MTAYRTPKTEAEFQKLPINMQGALWPICESCNHIAQEHNNHASESPEAGGCGYVARGRGRCPTCGTHAVDVKCPCTGYDGPKNVAELIEYLNK